MTSFSVEAMVDTTCICCVLRAVQYERACATLRACAHAGCIISRACNFRGWGKIRENRENYAPRKFGAIRYHMSNNTVFGLLDLNRIIVEECLHRGLMEWCFPNPIFAVLFRPSSLEELHYREMSIPVRCTDGQ